MVKFSIVIPVYNVAPFLRTCLDSLLGQTYSEWEAICIDDGSTDRSSDILWEYARRDARIKVFCKENGGVSSARNLGLDIATGDWIGFLDGDDEYSPLLLQSVSCAVERTPDVDIVACGLMRIPEDGHLCSHGDAVGPDLVVDTSVEVSLDVRVSSFCQGFYRHEKFGDIRFSGYKMGEDRLYFAECICRCDRFIKVSGIGYAYRARSGSAVSGGVTKEKVRDYIRFAPDILELFDASGKKTPWKELYWNVLGLHQKYIRQIGANSDVQDLWGIWYNTIERISHLKMIDAASRRRCEKIAMRRSGLTSYFSGVFCWQIRRFCKKGLSVVRKIRVAASRRIV